MVAAAEDLLDGATHGDVGWLGVKAAGDEVNCFEAVCWAVLVWCWVLV